jgi:hypothetical protein
MHKRPLLAGCFSYKQRMTRFSGEWVGGSLPDLGAVQADLATLQELPQPFEPK